MKPLLFVFLLLLTCFSCTNQTRFIQPISPRMICEVGFENQLDKTSMDNLESKFQIQKSFILKGQTIYVHAMNPRYMLNKHDKSDHWYKIDLSTKAFNDLYHSDHFQKSSYSTIKFRKAESEGCILGPFPISYKLYQKRTFWNFSYPSLDEDFNQVFKKCDKANEISENAVPPSVLQWEKRIVHSTEQILNTEHCKEVTKSKTVSFSE